MIDSNSSFVNKADFQRHFNGFERRLDKFTRSIEIFSKIHSNSFEFSREQMKQLSQEETNLSSIISDLDRSSFVSTVEKRFDRLKKSFSTHRNLLEILRKKFDVKPTEIDVLISTESIELNLLNETNQKIQRVEKDLEILNGTFYDLHRIVHEQGFTIENIEEAMSTADQMVDDGKQQIETTIQVKKRTKKPFWILVVILLTVFLLLILVIFLVYKFSFPFSRN